MEKMYNWEYIYRGDIYRMENGKGVLEEKNIVDYHNISLTQNELIELNNTIKYKIEEIMHKRKSEDEELQYDIVMVSIPVQKKETCNL